MKSKPLVLTNEDILEAIKDYMEKCKMGLGSTHFRVLVADTGMNEIKYLDGDDLRFLVLAD